MDPHPYGWLSILPPIIAIVLAVVTRRAVLSLLLGIFAGAVVTAKGNLLTAGYDFFEVHLWPTLIDAGKMRVFAFTLLMGAMVGVISRGGGMQGLIQKLSPLAKTRRGGQLTTWLLGWVIFFDDYANTILLGNTLRPLCDRLRISREKLAYLVDSTAAPIAGMALISTWVAVEIDYIREGLDNVAGAGSVSALDLFVGSIPYRFYVLGALLFVPLLAIFGREFGPMLEAERVCAAGQTSKGYVAADPDEDAIDDTKGRWFNAAIPIAVMLAVVIWLLLVTGRQALGDGAADASLRDIFGSADSPLALLYGALAGLVVAGLLCRVQGILNLGTIGKAAGNGAKVVLPALAILWCASTLSRQTGNKSVAGESSPIAQKYKFDDHRLYTGEYMAELVLPEKDAANSLTIKLLPTIVFVLAAVLAFATGTSFGTMGILVPMVVSLVCPLVTTDGVLDPSHPILLASLASVLAGAVFGDHCSPISDTTILSSQASGCDHVAHVVTQMPYAVVVGAVAILLGTLPIGWNVPVAILLPIQAIALVVVVRMLGKQVDGEPKIAT